MGTPYVGEIRLFAGNFAPAGWMTCDGQILAISEYDTLFNLIGTTYGGDGQSTFALPNLSGRIAVHQGNGNVIGQMAGTENVSLILHQIPNHRHVLNAQTTTGQHGGPTDCVWADSSLEQFSTAAATTTMAANMNNTGGDQPHNNMPTFLVVNFIISLFGVYPSQS